MYSRLCRFFRTTNSHTLVADRMWFFMFLNTNVSLNCCLQPVVETLKQQIYKELNGMVPIDASSIFEAAMMPMTNAYHEPLKSTYEELGTHDIYGVVDNSNQMEYFTPGLRNSFIIKELINEAYDPNVAAIDINDLQTGTSLWQGNELLIDPSNQILDIFSSDFGICFSSNGSPRARWCKIRAALKWGSVRRDVAAKKKAGSYSYLDFLV